METIANTITMDDTCHLFEKGTYCSTTRWTCVVLLVGEVTAHLGDDHSRPERVIEPHWD